MENGANCRTGGIVLWRVVMESREESDIVRSPHQHTGEQHALVLPSKVRRVNNLTVQVHHAFSCNKEACFTRRIHFSFRSFKKICPILRLNWICQNSFKFASCFYLCQWMDIGVRGVTTALVQRRVEAVQELTRERVQIRRHYTGEWRVTEITLKPKAAIKIHAQVENIFF